MSAEEVRAAAQRLRWLAKGTSPLPWGRHDSWVPGGGGYVEAVTEIDWNTGLARRAVAWVPTFSNDTGQTPGRDRAMADADWMAATSPLLAEPLAALLEAAADLPEALALARKINPAQED